MTDNTKKLCLWASALYENGKFSRDEIYHYLINTKSRLKEVAQTKQLVGYILYNHFDYTLQMIADEFSLFNHSTICYWMDKVQMAIKTNKRMQFKYDYMLECLNGNVKEIRRVTAPVGSKQILTDADKEFIRINIDKGYNIAYISDALKKSRGIVKSYLLAIKRKTVKFDDRSVNRVRVHSFNKRQSIDY